MNITRGKFPNYAKRLIGWLRYADQKGYDALILVVDQDGDADRETGVNFAQQSAAFNIRRAFGLAIRAFDAWMLADEQTVSRAFSQTVHRQPDPETLQSPKQHFENLMSSHKCPTSQTATYIAICQQLSVDILTSRCPIGFAKFRQRVEALSFDKGWLTRG